MAPYKIDGDMYEVYAAIEYDPAEDIMLGITALLLDYDAVDGDYDGHTLICEEVDAVVEDLKTRRFSEVMLYCDHLTEGYGLTHTVEGEQASEAAYSHNDWRECVMDGYVWHVIQAAFIEELRQRGRDDILN